MPSPIEFTPELLANVVAYLGVGDLSLLMQVSKAHHKVIEPFLWTMIEMHDNQFHAKIVHEELCAEKDYERQKIPYCIGSREPPLRLRRFLKTFSPHRGLQRERQSQLGSLVTFICLPLKPYETGPPRWASFEHFSNLAYLDLSGYWHGVSASSSFSAPERSLSKLRVLKLRGYFPKAFVQWLLREPVGIEELQLAILDNPIGACCDDGEEWENPPPLENQPPEGIHGEELAMWESTHHEDLVHQWVAPRALACLTPGIIRRFANLKNLYLCKPSDGEDMDVLYFSEPSDRAITEEWAALLKATRNTLQTITFDLRPVAQQDVADGSNNKDYMRECANGASYKLFVSSVLPILLESKEFANLKAVRLFGFEAHDEGVDTEYARERIYPNDSVDVPSQLQAAFPDAEIIDGVGRRLVIENDSGVVMSSEYIMIPCY
jgi:hypothetical protein